MSTVRFLLDENVDPRLGRLLPRRSPPLDVSRIGDPGRPDFGTADPDLLIWCEANGPSLVTNNRISMLAHLTDHLLAGRHVPDIFILNANLSLGETAEELMLIWGAAEAEEYIDRLIYLPLGS